jgi:hypothetical protein
LWHVQADPSGLERLPSGLDSVTCFEPVIVSLTARTHSPEILQIATVQRVAKHCAKHRVKALFHVTAIDRSREHWPATG